MWPDGLQYRVRDFQMSTADTPERSRQIANLAQEIREHLGDHNVLDSLARELARDRLLIADLVGRLDATEKELAALKVAQKARDILMPQASQEYKGRREATIESSAPLPADRGFHALERDGNGAIFRWTGPSQHFHYDLHLDRSVPLMFSLQVPMWGAEHAKGLSCTSEGRNIPLRRRQLGRTVVLDGMLDPRAEPGLTRIDFLADHLQTVAPKTEGGKSRQLGLPVLRLKVAPVDEAARQDWVREVGLADADAEDPAVKPAAAAKPAPKPVAGAQAAR